MLVKICGLNQPENIRGIGKLGPDMMGFIFSKSSPRNADPIAVSSAVRSLPSRVYRVGVFVNENLGTIRDIAELLQLHYVQLHGDESPEFSAQCKRIGLGVIKAVQVDPISGELGYANDVLARYEAIADMILFDTKTASRGGSGKRFDHGKLESNQLSIPYLVAGGLGVDEVRDVLELSSAAGADFNSRLELGPGFKDLDLVSEVIMKMRQ